MPIGNGIAIVEALQSLWNVGTTKQEGSASNGVSAAELKLGFAVCAHAKPVATVRSEYYWPIAVIQHLPAVVVGHRDNRRLRAVIIIVLNPEWILHAAVA